MTVVTRFAPSPTGYLHIGGARTALFNFLYARRYQGRYLLRIEDTDKARSTKDNIDAIHDALNWLELDSDGDVAHQSTRIERHIEVAQQLMQSGRAYRCYLTEDELAAIRQEARKIGHPVRSPWRDRPPEAAPDAPYVVRLKMPRTGETTITDAVQGKVTVKHEQLDDLVMLRSDGAPTYMLAVVVDDHDMGVTHVIRGDDHLNNAFRQQKIIEAMDWPVPVYAHIPLIHGADGAKLSKRHGALSVTEYRKMGILPDALNNYLLRLGWGHGDDEIISREQAIAWFDLDEINKAPARFDPQRLDALNAHYMRQLDDADILALITEGKTLGDEIKTRLLKLAPAIKQRATRTGDLVDMAAFAMQNTPPEIPEDAAALLDEVTLARLAELAKHYPADNKSGDINAVKDWLDEHLEARGLKMRDLGVALRLALTGSRQAPELALILAVLGKEQIVQRIGAVCNTFGKTL